MAASVSFRGTSAVRGAASGLRPPVRCTPVPVRASPNRARASAPSAAAWAVFERGGEPVRRCGSRPGSRCEVGAVLEHGPPSWESRMGFVGSARDRAERRRRTTRARRGRWSTTRRNRSGWWSSWQAPRANAMPVRDPTNCRESWHASGAAPAAAGGDRHLTVSPPPARRCRPVRPAARCPNPRAAPAPPNRTLAPRPAARGSRIRRSCAGRNPRASTSRGWRRAA